MCQLFGETILSFLGMSSLLAGTVLLLIWVVRVLKIMFVEIDLKQVMEIVFSRREEHADIRKKIDSLKFCIIPGGVLFVFGASSITGKLCS